MAATVVGKKADAGRNGEDRDDFTADIRETYIVETTDKGDGVITVANASGIPELYAPYITDNEFHFGLRCNGRRVSQTESPYVWEVEVSYGSMSRDEDEENEDPTQRPPQVRFNFENVEIPVVGEHNDVVNADGKHFKGPIRNKAGTIFDPPPMMREARPVLELEVFRSNVNPSQIFSYANAVNADFFMGAEPRTLLMDPPSVTRVFENGVKCWQLQWRMTYRAKTWDLQIINQGYQYRTPAGTLRTFGITRDPATGTEDGTPFIGLLKEDGQPLPAGADTVILRFEIYKKLPFGVLGIERILS